MKIAPARRIAPATTAVVASDVTPRRRSCAASPGAAMVIRISRPRRHTRRRGRGRWPPGRTRRCVITIRIPATTSAIARTARQNGRSGTRVTTPHAAFELDPQVHGAQQRGDRGGDHGPAQGEQQDRPVHSRPGTRPRPRAASRPSWVSAAPTRSVSPPRSATSATRRDERQRDRQPSGRPRGGRARAGRRRRPRRVRPRRTGAAASAPPRRSARSRQAGSGNLLLHQLDVRPGPGSGRELRVERLEGAAQRRPDIDQGRERTVSGSPSKNRPVEVADPGAEDPLERAVR